MNCDTCGNAIGDMAPRIQRFDDNLKPANTFCTRDCAAVYPVLMRLRALREELKELREDIGFVTANSAVARQAIRRIQKLLAKYGGEYRVGWECVNCGAFHPCTSIDVEAVECRCGKGKGRWAKAEQAQKETETAA